MGLLFNVRVFLLLCSITLACCHPQCLDFKPPFENTKRLTFCDQYSDFGCCDNAKDAEIEKDYLRIKKLLESEGVLTCDMYLKEILCQECSPYAIHIYDAETSGIWSRTFPGLCQDYCSSFYDHCSEIVKHITQDQGFITALGTKTEFCQKVSLSDRDYCFPNLLTDPRLNGDISRVQRTAEGCLCLEEFADNLGNPLIFRTAPGDDRIFIGEQVGIVHIYYKNKTKLPEPFLDIQELVLTSSRNGDERGFLGLTFHPNFTTNQKLYVYFSMSGDNREKIRISEFTVNGSNANKVDQTSERVLLEVGEPWWNHNGGEILFGVDGYLYAFIGDGGSGGDPLNFAQRKNTFLGKVIRIDVNRRDPGMQYAVPPDNPFVNEADAVPEIYAYGVRNIWRCDVDEGDPLTGEGRGRILCGDVGQSAWEEIDIIERGGNYGWNSREGFQCYRSSTCGKIGPEVLPIHAYSHAEGRSVTGGHVYRGCLSPNLQGLYIYGDFMDGRIWRLKENKTSTPSTWDNEEMFMCGQDTCLPSLGLTSDYQTNILSFGEDQDGEIYVLTTNWASPTSKTGKVYKMLDPRRRGDPKTCRTYVPPPPPPTPQAATTPRPTKSPSPTTPDFGGSGDMDGGCWPANVKRECGYVAAITETNGAFSPVPTWTCWHVDN